MRLRVYLNKDALGQEAAQRVCVGGGAARQADVKLGEAVVARHQGVVVIQHLLLCTGQDVETHLDTHTHTHTLY